MIKVGHEMTLTEKMYLPAITKGLSLTFKVKAGEEGKLFGSVTNADITDKLNQGELDFEIDRRQIMLDEPIKQIGAFEVPIRFHAQVEVLVEVRTERMDD